MSISANLHAYAFRVFTINVKTTQLDLSCLPRVAPGLAAMHVRLHQKISEESRTLKVRNVQLLDFIPNSVSVPVGNI